MSPKLLEGFDIFKEVFLTDQHIKDVLKSLEIVRLPKTDERHSASDSLLIRTPHKTGADSRKGVPGVRPP